MPGPKTLYANNARPKHLSHYDEFTANLRVIQYVASVCQDRSSGLGISAGCDGHSVPIAPKSVRPLGSFTASRIAFTANMVGFCLG